MGASLILKAIGKFIVDNWQIISVIIVALSVFLYWDHRTSLIANQQKQITTLIGDKATVEANCRSDKQKLLDQINQLNLAVLNFQNQNKDNQGKLNQAKSDVIRIQQQYTEQMKKILMENKPGDCQAAIKYLVDGAVEITTPAPASNKEKTK